MMGCRGVKAFESDEGLDVLEWIINHIPEDGCLRLKEFLNQLKLDEWCRPPAAENGEYHSSTMLIAELMESFQNGTIEEWEYLPKNSFEKVVSFLVEKESVEEMREYLSKTLESRLTFLRLTSLKYVRVSFQNIGIRQGKCTEQSMERMVSRNQLEQMAGTYGKPD